MSDNWVVQNLQKALATWNEKLQEIWTLLMVSPEKFKGGRISQHYRCGGVTGKQVRHLGSTRFTFLCFQKLRTNLGSRCHKCGRWVIDAMYNADVLECVECAPWEGEPVFCKTCGSKASAPGRVCPVCGELLTYEGRDGSP